MSFMNHSGVPPFDFEHHLLFELAQPVVDEKKRNENRRDADRHEPFIADVTRRMKGQAFGRKLVVELLDERFERRAFESQRQFGDAALQ